MKKSTVSGSVARMTQTALLIALIVLSACLPLKIFTLEFTLSTIPVVVGAILLGPATGALLGGVFGLCSFAQCFGWFFPSTFGAALVSINPWYTAVVCLVPRILMGWLSGWIAYWMRRCNRVAAYGVSCLAAAVLNTVLFTGTLLLLFGHTELIQNQRGTRSLMAFAVAFVGVNGVVEAVVNLIVGTAIASALSSMLHRQR